MKNAIAQYVLNTAELSDASTLTERFVEGASKEQDDAALVDALQAEIGDEESAKSISQAIWNRCAGKAHDDIEAILAGF